MDDSSEAERLIPKNEEDGNNKKDNEVSTDNHKGWTCRRLCIVPVMILYFYTIGIISFAVPEYIQTRVKENIESEKNKTPLTGNTSHGGSDIDISPCDQNTSSPEYQIHTEIQQQSAKWLMYIGLAGSIPALVSNLVFGSYSDVLGRRFVFGISTLGFTILCIAVTIVVHFKANLLFIILGTLVDSASGSATVFFAVQFSYISDITYANKRRSIAIVLCELILGVTVSVSSLVTGYFIKYTGFFYPMLTATLLCAIAFILSVTIIPETLPHRNRSENKSCLRNVIRSVKLYTSPGTQRKRFKYLLLIISFTFMVISMGGMSLEALYQLGRPFCWDASKIGWFGTVKISCMSFIGLGFVLLFHRCLSDDSIAIIGNISGIISYVVEGLAKTDLILYTGKFYHYLNKNEPTNEMLVLLSLNDQGKLS